MASAGGKEVGRVSIRVVPNTDGFKSKVEAALSTLRDIKVKVNPEIDSEELKREAKRAADHAEQEIKFEPDLDQSSLAAQARIASLAASRFKVRFRAVLDGKLATLQAAALADRLQNIANGKDLKFSRDSLSLRHAMDVSGLTDGLDLAIDRLRVMRVHMKEMDRFAKHASIAAALSGGRKWGTFRPQLFKMKGQMKIASEGVWDMTKSLLGSIKPWAAFKNSIRGFISIGNVLGTTVGIAAAGMGVFSAATIGVSYVIGGVVDGAKTLSKNLLLLPAAAAMAGGAFAAVRMAFSGFGEAAKAALDPSADLEESVAGLAPSAKDSAYALRSLAQPLQDIKSRVQQTTFEGWGDQIREAGQRLLPVLDTGLVKIAGGVNSVGRGFLEWAGAERTADRINRILGHTGTTMGYLGKSTKPFLTGLTELATAGAERLNFLASKIPNLGEKFEEWATSTKGQAEMRKWMADGVEGLQDLWSAASNVGSAFKQIGNAFGVSFNGDALSRLDRATESFRNWLGTADDANSRISRFAQSAKDIAGPWIDTFTRVKDALTPAFNEMVPFIKDVSREMAENIASTMEFFGPIIEDVFGFLNKHKDVFAPLIAGLMSLRLGIGIFKLLRAAAAPFFSLITGGAGLVGKMFGRGGKDAAKGASAAGKGAGKAGKEAKKGSTSFFSFGKNAEKAGKSTAKAGKHAASSAGKFGKIGKVGSVAGKGLRGVGTAAKFAVRGLARMVPGLGQVVMAAEVGYLIYQNWDKIGPVVGKAKDSVVDFGKKVVTKIGDGWHDAKERFKEFPSEVKRGLGKAGDRLSEFGGKVKSAFKKKGDDWSKDQIVAGSVKPPKWEDIKGGFEDLKNRIGDFFKDPGGSISSAWDSVKEKWLGTWDAITNGLSEKWAAVTTTASTVWTATKALVGAAWDGITERWTGVWSAIGAWLTAAWTGLQTMATASWTVFKEFVGSVWDGLVARWTAVWTVITTTLSALWLGIQTLAMSAWTGVTTFLSTVWDTVTLAWTIGWTMLSSFLSGVWSSISSTASSMFSSVASAVSSAWSAVSSATSSAWSSVVGTVTGAVGSVISAAASMAGSVIGSVVSLASGIVSTISGAMSSFVSAVSSGFSQAVGLAASLPGQVVGALGNVGGLLVSSGVALVQGFVNGIRSMIGAVRSAASAVVSAARSFFPFSPAKEGPFSGKGYTTYSGKALVKDFAGGMLSEVRAVKASAESVAKAASAPFDALNKRKVLEPVLEQNAKTIADARKREAEATEQHNKAMAEAGDNAEKRAKLEEKHAEKMAEIRKDRDEALEAPDYRDIDRSFRKYYVEGAKELLAEKLKQVVKDRGLVEQAKAGARKAVEQARSVVGDHPILAKVDYNIDAPYLNDALNNLIDESGIAAVPVEFVVSNLEQLKQDLGMGDGVISRAIDAAMDYNVNNSDAKRFGEPKEVHYHVEDMQEAIRLENLRERKQMMKLG